MVYFLIRTKAAKHCELLLNVRYSYNYEQQQLKPPLVFFSFSPVPVYVGEAVPTGAPRELRAEAVSPTEVRLSWRPPEADRQNGDLLGYKIFYHRTSEWSLFLFAVLLKKVRRKNGQLSISVVLQCYSRSEDVTDRENRWLLHQPCRDIFSLARRT